MALTYTHLCGLFSDQYLHEQAIYYGKHSLPYYDQYEAEPWHVAWILHEIGSHYDMMNQTDTSYYYYHKALDFLPDTNSLTFRMISGHLAFLDYKTTHDEKRSLSRLYQLLEMAESSREYYSRCLAIGEIYYHETQYDSAWNYLTKVFNESASVDSKKQAAEWLVEICKVQNRCDEISGFTNFLVPFANQNENNGTVKSQLAEYYGIFIQQKQRRLNLSESRLHIKRIGLIIGGLLVFTITILLLYHRNKRKNQHLKAQIVKYEVEQKALGGRLKRSNEMLRELENKIKQQEKKTNKNDRKTAVSYVEEPICQYILRNCQDKTKPIKSNVPVSEYADIALTHKQKAMLKEAATKHYGYLFQWLKTTYPCLREKDLFYCYLCLLGLDNTQIAAMEQLSYTSVWEREKRLQGIFDTNNSIAITLNTFLVN